MRITITAFAFIMLVYFPIASHSESHSEQTESDDIRQSPRGDSETLPTLRSVGQTAALELLGEEPVEEACGASA